MMLRNQQTRGRCILLYRLGPPRPSDIVGGGQWAETISTRSTSPGPSSRDASIPTTNRLTLPVQWWITERDRGQNKVLKQIQVAQRPLLTSSLSKSMIYDEAIGRTQCNEGSGLSFYKLLLHSADQRPVQKSQQATF